MNKIKQNSKQQLWEPVMSGGWFWFLLRNWGECE